MTFQETLNADPQVCVVCKSDFVYPVERYQINDQDWRILLLCPECQTLRETIVDRDVVRELLRTARIRREGIPKELKSMEKKHMEEEAEKTISAIQKDRILPIDFGTPSDEQIEDTERGWKRVFEILKFRQEIEDYMVK